MFKNIKFGCLGVLLLLPFLLVASMLLLGMALTFLFKWHFVFSFLLMLFALRIAYLAKGSRPVEYLKKIIKKVCNHITDSTPLGALSAYSVLLPLIFIAFIFSYINLKFIDLIVFLVVCIVSLVVEIFLRSKFERKKGGDNNKEKYKRWLGLITVQALFSLFPGFLLLMLFCCVNSFGNENIVYDSKAIVVENRLKIHRKSGGPIYYVRLELSDGSATYFKNDICEELHSKVNVGDTVIVQLKQGLFRPILMSYSDILHKNAQR
ncbi:MAG: hypothetical protein IJF46_04520 [Bacteroidaceae bacterium]|nr:hypothetical protein [Bacteroidaceae bacterium]